MAARARTITAKELQRGASSVEAVDYPDDVERPLTRGDCVDGPRPCPWVSCKYNLYLDVSYAGGIKINHPGTEPEEMHVSCALDVAEGYGETLEAIGDLIGLTRERVRQIEQDIFDTLSLDEILTLYFKERGK